MTNAPEQGRAGDLAMVETGAKQARNQVRWRFVPVLAVVLPVGLIAAGYGVSKLEPLGSPQAFHGRLAAACLVGLLAGYPILVLAAALGLVAALLLAVIPQGNGLRTRIWRLRISALAVSLLLAIGFAELSASVWLERRHRLPRLDFWPAPIEAAEKRAELVVIGGSSALGCPYEDWLSVGAIVERTLADVLPDRRVRVRVLAERGAALEAQHQKLAQLRERPDVVIVYSGHNEFLARFSLEARTYYYDDERTDSRAWALLEHAGGVSALIRLARENLERIRVGIIPARSFGSLERTIGRPAATAVETRAVYADFERRLEAIARDCARLHCAVIFVIPPGNDAADPNQSCALPATTQRERASLYKKLLELRALEIAAPDLAIVGYQAMLKKQPTLAIAHHRLGRLFDRNGAIPEANQHYRLARDLDGLPLRCVTPLEEAYRRVATRYPGTVELIDGPDLLRSASRRGILDDELFHDLVHPTLSGHVLLANAVLVALRGRGLWDWPESTPVPAIDAAWAARTFHLDAAAWSTVCRRSAAQYEMIGFFTPDPSERMSKRDRYLEGIRRIQDGELPSRVGIPGVGVSD